ncbi:MAG: RloB family protein, partial [Bullifex sp.]
MAAIRSYADWNKRSSDLKTQIEPYRRYVFICEGENTERRYFSHLIEIRKELGIHPLIDLKLLEKPEGEESFSNPKKLIELADRLKRKMGDGYDKSHDRMVIVFDADIYKRKPKEYEEILKHQGEYIFAVTNPSFELYLLLHYENSFRTIIEPNADAILKNKTAYLKISDLGCPEDQIL